MKENAKKTPNTTAISEMTDDSFEKMVKGICDNYDEWLDNEYQWPNQSNNCKAMNEQETVSLFYGYSDLLRKGQIEESIAGIFKWGGANLKRTKQEQTDFANAIRKLKQERIDFDENLDQILKMGNNPKSHSSRIAFWSKVLAAYKPGVCYIYDSRVAIALSDISRKLVLPDVWRIPSPRKTKTCKGICRFSNHSNPCYRLYLELLHRLAAKEEIKGRYDALSHEIKDAYAKMFQDQDEGKQKSIMAHLEKMLFMMKDKICGNCRLH